MIEKEYSQNQVNHVSPMRITTIINTSKTDVD